MISYILGANKLQQVKIVDYSCLNRELLSAMQDKEAGIPLQSFEINGCMYKHCFTGIAFNRIL